MLFHLHLVLLSNLQLARASLGEGCRFPRLANDILIADCVDATGFKFIYADVDRSVWTAYYRDKNDSADAGRMIYANWKDSTTTGDVGRRSEPSEDLDGISLQSLEHIIPVLLPDPRAPFDPFGPDVEQGRSHSSASSGSDPEQGRSPPAAPPGSDLEQGRSPSSASTSPGLVQGSGQPAVAPGDNAPTDQPFTKTMAYLALDIQSKLSVQSVVLSILALVYVAFPVLGREDICGRSHDAKICVSVEGNNNNIADRNWKNKLLRECVDECYANGEPCEQVRVTTNRFSGHTTSVKNFCITDVGGPQLPKTGGPSLDSLD